MRSNHELLLVGDRVFQRPFRGLRHRMAGSRFAQPGPHLLSQDVACAVVRRAGVVVQRPTTNRPVHVPLRPGDLDDIDTAITAREHDLLGHSLQLSLTNLDTGATRIRLLHSNRHGLHSYQSKGCRSPSQAQYPRHRHLFDSPVCHRFRRSGQ